MDSFLKSPLGRSPTSPPREKAAVQAFLGRRWDLQILRILIPLKNRSPFSVLIVHYKNVKISAGCYEKTYSSGHGVFLLPLGGRTSDREP